MISKKQRNAATLGILLAVAGFAATPVKAQVAFDPVGPVSPSPGAVCAIAGAILISDSADECTQDDMTPVSSLTFGAGSGTITFTDAGTATFSQSTVQMSGLQAYSGTSTFNSTVSFVGPSVTFDTGTTFNESASFRQAITAHGISNTGSISSTSVFAANAGLTDLSSATVDIELSLSMMNGANVDMGGNQIHGVAAGTAATDAVNVAQLNAMNAEVAEDIFFLDAVTSAHTDQITQIQAVDAAQSTQIAALEATNATLGSNIDSLFDLRSRDRRDMKQGIASAMAMASAPMPSEPGRIAYAVNGATFRGEYAVGGSLTYRLNSRTPMAVNVGFSYAGNKNNGVRAGVAGEF